MLSRMARLATIAAAAAVASSCASKDAIQLQFPPAADLKVQAEPAYPEAALDPCPTNLRSDPCPAEDAERQWNDDILFWGRTGWDQAARNCRWARGLGARDADGKPIECPPPKVGQ